MGGSNSGRYGGRPTIEACGSYRLRIKDLLRNAPCPGIAEGKITWGLDGDGESLTADYRLVLLADGTGTLDMIHRERNDRAQLMAYQIRLVTTRPNYGGRRWWWICPHLAIRAATLVLPRGGNRFASRRAYGLAYQSTRLDRMGRCHRAIAKLEARLGDDGARPQGMHQRTYDRLCARLDAKEAELDEAFSRSARRWLDRLDARSPFGRLK